MSEEHAFWTIEDLARRVAEALIQDYAGSPDNRVRDVPDLRSIRYYTTLGLLDRPTMRGRTAFYGVRHVLQLAAIKRLQAARWPLARIQQTLLHLKDSDLTRIAQVGEQAVQPQPASEKPSSRAFWKEAPTLADVCQVEAGEEARAAEALPAPLAGLIQGIELADDATLLVRTARPLDDDDIQAIRAVAGPLVMLLGQRRLIARAEKGPSHDPATRDFV